jgi:molybdopterin-biosynthesis enzyme MoeA-like protein
MAKVAHPRFFALIIGTEILNRRREDSHFLFLSEFLLSRGYRLSGSFVIEDDPALIEKSLSFLANIDNSVVFSFGGIGSTPDDHTRISAARALEDGKLYLHDEAARIIEDRLGEKAYPYPIRMAQLPKGAKLLHNPVNRMPAFYLKERFFFMPGFPQMSHPMVEWIMDNIYSEKSEPQFRKTLQALCRESELIDIMEALPKNVELSSLPKLYSDGPRVVISVSSKDKKAAEDAYLRFTKALEERGINYSPIEE